MNSPRIVFAVETSCDETSTALVDVAARRVIALDIYSQYAEHAPYGGVVPELASRAHLERLPGLAAATLARSGLGWGQVDAIAATVGPGLTTALVVGSTFAQTLALALNKPFLGANHIEGHALSPMLALADGPSPEVEPPYLLMLLTGGHCQLVWVEAVGRYTTLGTTLDDAVGECFDKVGKILGLPHPAGPALEKRAATGTVGVSLPFPKRDGSMDFSFSGLKTAVKDIMAGANPPPVADMAASFQAMVADVLSYKLAVALQHTGARCAVIGGGVAANKALRVALLSTCQQHGARFVAPPGVLCTDNAAMVGLAAGLRARAGLPTGALGMRPVPRWPLETMGAEALLV